MIYKGIVESMLDQYRAKVRIPVLHRASFAPKTVATADLPEALICTLSGCQGGIKQGDIVFIAHEDNDLSKPVIIGHLYSEQINSAYPSLHLETLDVLYSANLPSDTYIGNISPENLSQLADLTVNVQHELELINSKIKNIEDLLKTSNT